MTDEEKKEINKLKEKYQTEFLDDYELRFIFNVVKKQQEEIEKYKYLYQKALDNTIKADKENIKKDKIIDKMIDALMSHNEHFNYCDKKLHKKHKGNCQECLKEYFINKAEEEN